MSVALNHYETLTILNADLSDDALKGIISSASAIIEDGSGVIHKVDEWGRRRLAYPILKRNDGFYFLMTYSSAVDPRREMERRFKLNEDVMRTQTILIDEAAVEAVKESIVKEAAAKEEALAREAAAKVEAEAKEVAAKVEAEAKEAAAKVEAEAKEAAAKVEAEEGEGLKEATELVKEAAKAAPAPNEKKDEVDPAIKEASDMVSAAAKAATATVKDEDASTETDSTEEEGGENA